MPNFRADGASPALDLDSDAAGSASTVDLNWTPPAPAASGVSDLVYRPDQQREFSPQEAWGQTQGPAQVRLLAGSAADVTAGEGKAAGGGERDGRRRECGVCRRRAPRRRPNSGERRRYCFVRRVARAGARMVVLVSAANVDQIVAHELEKAAQAISRVSQQIAESAVHEYDWHMRNQMRAILGR